MSLSREEVRHVAGLARLKLTEEEEARFQTQLAQILDAFRALESVPTDGIEPTLHAILGPTTLREDARQPSLKPAQSLANAPAAVETYFAVPKVLET